MLRSFMSYSPNVKVHCPLFIAKKDIHSDNSLG